MEAANSSTRPINIVGSPGLAAFLTAENLAIAFTTYRSGTVGIVTTGSAGDLASSQTNVGHAAGLDIQDGRLWVAAGDFIRSWPLGAGSPSQYRIRPDHEPHELRLSGKAALVVSTARSGVYRIDGGETEVWRPAFIRSDEPEDRCHLNGIHAPGGRVMYATALGATDTPAGWRQDLRGGVLLDGSGEPLVENLWLPHSPRRRAGTTWLLESGTGTIGTISGGGYQPVAELPGFPRGLAFTDGRAIVGLSIPWPRKPIPLIERLASQGAFAMCGFVVVELESGSVEHTCRIDAPGGSVFDVGVIHRDATG